jgi:hypothetical protein
MRKETSLLAFKDTEQESGRSLPSAGDYAPRQYSFRTSAALTAKLLMIGGSVLASLWIIDVLLAP